jgi:nitroimidazol reductase NimA-like FMN-containing flavoprotein (pyridoxamine 5'-phosphate oxidase superfamily)
MSAPETTLDTGFSDPAAAPTSWDDTRQALEGGEIFWIATVRRDGRPHVTPLVAVWLGEAIYFCTGPNEQKAINLAHNPHVTLTTGCNDWDRGLDVVVEGDAVRVTEDGELHRLADAWTTKWDGRWHYGVADGGFELAGSHVLVFAVKPAKVFAFGKGTFSQTRHRFPSNTASDT